MGTSVPRRSNELKGTPPSPVKEYKLSPEELAKIDAKPIPKAQTKPIEFRAKTSIPKNEEDVKDMPKVNKADYLELRVKGVSKKDAAKKLGTSLASLESYWLPKQWGIKSDAAEEIEIARYKESRQENKQAAAPAIPSVHVIETQEPAQPQMIEFEITTSDKPSQNVIPTLPVQITQEQADALKLILSHKSADEIVLRHSQTFIITRERWLEDLEPLNDLSLDDMIRAVYFGYEIKRTPEQQLLYEFERAETRYEAHHQAVAFRTGLQIAAEILGQKVVGVND